MIAETSKPQILVLGGGSLVGRYLLPLLAAQGYRGYVVSRKPPEAEEATALHFAWLSAAQVQDASWHLQEKAVIISLWPLWLLSPVMPQFLGAAQLIALSSTSLFGKAGSLDRGERDLVQRIGRAEAQVRINSETFRIPYTILRPTLIYDGVQDQSITFIARIIRRFGFFLVAGEAAGLRQPIHAEDVATAIIRSIGNENAYNQSFNIIGGETITYFTMIRRISEAVGKNIRIIPCPKWILKGLIHLMRALDLTQLSPSLFDRMNQDLAYDGTAAEKALQLTPRGFLPSFHAKR